MKRLMLRWLTLLATFGMIAVNGMANGLPINGKTTGDISRMFDVAFTPAGWVFSIWGLIYTGLIVFSIVQALPKHRDDERLAAVRPWYLLNTGANAAWIVAWHHLHFELALVIMLVILGTLAAIRSKLSDLSFADGGTYVTQRVPFTLYFAWITIATIANTTVVIWDAGITEPLTDPYVTLGLVALATAMCAVLSLRSDDPVVAAVYVWAIVGIASKNQGEPTLYMGALACAAACALVGGIASRAALHSRRAAP